jgi:NodT family efflux transporter outer membrane factor (OMF) lipoprotein
VKRALLVSLAAFAAGCSVGPKYTRPPVVAPQAYKELRGWKVAQPAEATLRRDWWNIFGDSDLEALESQIDVSNENLKVVEARFRAARAALRFSRSARFPAVTGGAAVTTNRGSASRETASRTTTVSYGDFLLPVDLNYEADVWGRIRRQIEAARTEAQASAADIETLRLALHAELARDYFELRSADAEQKLLDDTVAAYTRALQLTENRFEGGAASGAEVAQARAQLEAARTQQTDIGVRRTQDEHAIAILIGKAPAEFTLPAKVISLRQPPIPVGLPSELLERRPDVAAAERLIAAANEQIGIARAAFFPTVLLGAAEGLEGSSITNWLNWPSRFWAVGPAIAQTVFDAGRRRAQSEFAQANYDAAVASYRQTVLEAFQQVEDNIAQLRILERESQTQQAAVAAAQRSLQLSMNRYTGGLVTYLEVVTAQSTALANERTAVDILRRRMDASVLLVKALGGGWDVSTLPAL